MQGEDDSEEKSGRAGVEEAVHAGDVAVAQHIAGGDEDCWNTLVAALRPMVKKNAVEWCRRISPGGQCNICTEGEHQRNRRTEFKVLAIK